jgi:four helix bundle protein
MTAKSPQELVAWQLCHQLKNRVFPILERPRAKTDFGWCNQIRKSARSAPSLIEEGFGRFKPKDNARFVEMAKASVYETRGHLGEACERAYISADEYRDLYNLPRRALTVCGRYHAYLLSERAEKAAERARREAQARCIKLPDTNDP